MPCGSGSMTGALTAGRSCVRSRGSSGPSRIKLSELGFMLVDRRIFGPAGPANATITAHEVGSGGGGLAGNNSGISTLDYDHPSSIPPVLNPRSDSPSSLSPSSYLSPSRLIPATTTAIMTEERVGRRV